MRLQAVVVHAVTKGWRREFRRYCTFARKLDAPAFRARLEHLAGSKDQGVASRAQRVLNALDRKPSIWRRWQLMRFMSAEEQAQERAATYERIVASILRRVREYGHQMDPEDIRSDLAFAIEIGSPEAEAMLRRFEDEA